MKCAMFAYLPALPSGAKATASRGFGALPPRRVDMPQSTGSSEAPLGPSVACKQASPLRWTSRLELELELE